MNKTILTILSAILLFSSCAYNKYEEDSVDTYLDWSGYWYYQGNESYESYHRARLLAEKAMAEDPDNLMAKLIYGYSLLKLRIWEDDNPRKNTAKKVFKDIIEEEKDNYRAHLGLGITNIKLCKKNTGRLRDFQKLLFELDKLMKIVADIDKIKKNNAKSASDTENPIDTEINIKELQLVQDTNNYIKMVNLVVDGEIFPYMKYKSLVKKRENPGLSDIQEALEERIAKLVKSIDAAMIDYTFNYAVYIEDMNKLKLLFEIAEKYYKNEYTKQLDEAEVEFKYCLMLHEKYETTYFWVFDYLSILYALRATLNSDNEVLKMEYHELEKEYLIKFIKADMEFEGKRRKKITSDDIDELKDNPYFSQSVEDYQELMIGLIDKARELRQKRIMTLISLLANVFKDYDAALEWANDLKSTEERFENPKSIEPFLFHYFRVKIYLLKSNELEAKNKNLANLSYISISERNKIPEPVIEEHKTVWEEIAENAHKFMKKSSISKNNVERNEIEDILMLLLDRYPELYDTN